MKNIFLGEIFVNTTLDNIEIKTDMNNYTRSRYLMRSAMAGAIVIFGYMMILATDAAFSEVLDPFGKVLGATIFSLCLAAIYYTRSELLTSNMMMVSVAKYYDRINWRQIFKLLIYCYLGNIIGGLIIGSLLASTSIITPGMIESYEHSLTIKQGYIANQAYWDLFVRAIFCNLFINMAMLMVYSGNVKSDGAKIIAMFFGVFIFVYLGFEHSVANSMFFITAGMYQLINHVDIGFDLVLALQNIIIVLIGNFIGGGILIGWYYAFINDGRDFEDKIK